MMGRICKEAKVISIDSVETLQAAAEELNAMA
jgi:hypothetical protein